MKTCVVIPARMASTRMPGKPLAPLLGLPMIEHVRRRACLCDGVDQVIVATCDQEIIDVVEAAGGSAVMTSDRHERCTDRVAEAIEGVDCDYVINIQGDEPLVSPQMVQALVDAQNANPEIPSFNLVGPIGDQDFDNSNVVKVVGNRRFHAMYFSREPIPSRRKATDLSYPKWKQYGIIGFDRKFLATFCNLEPTPHEIAESVDMLRALEHGYEIKLVPWEFNGQGVDTEEDRVKAEVQLCNDPLTGEYHKW